MRGFSGATVGGKVGGKRAQELAAALVVGRLP